MSTFIQIDKTSYNLDFLVSVKFDETEREIFKRGVGFDQGMKIPTGETKIRSSLELRFAGLDPIYKSDQEASDLWNKIAKHIQY